ncbi:hypothetical protein [Gordonia sp. NPDC003376]
MGIQVTWTGDDIDIVDATEKGLQDGADYLMGESDDIAPIDEGDLIRSHIAVAQGTMAAVGYNSVYAARQHEEIDWNHKNGRQAKYLEKALNHNANEILEVIAEGIKDALGS